MELRVVVALLAVAGAWSPRLAAEDCAALLAEAEAAAALRDAAPERGVSAAEAALLRAAGMQPPCSVAEAMLHSAAGANLNILGRNREAVERYERALALLDAAEATEAQKAAAHRGVGVALADLEEFEDAIAHYLAALDASEAAGDVLEAAKSAGNIGNLYNTIGQLDRSQSYHERALKGFQQAGFKPGVAGTLINLGALAAKFASAAEERGDDAEMRRHNALLLDYNTQALALFTELGNERGIAYASSNIGLALDREGSPALAREYHERALALRRKIGDVHGEINSLVWLATTLVHLGNFDEAKLHLDEARARLPAPNLGLESQIVAASVELAEARGDFGQALRLQREVTRLYSRMADEDQRTRVAQLQSGFDSREQARQIELLRSQAEIQNLQLGRQRMLLAAGTMVAALLVVILAMLWGRHRASRANARELDRAASTDPVTGLANRRSIVQRVEREIARAEKSGQPFSLVMADIDHFKDVNDRFGHGAGDQVLLEVGRRLRAQLRDVDVVARWGGEEFLLLLPETPRERAAQVAERLRVAIADAPFVVDGRSIPLTATLGVTACLGQFGMDACVKQADEALYAGKRQGRNRVVVAVPVAAPA